MFECSCGSRIFRSTDVCLFDVLIKWRGMEAPGKIFGALLGLFQSCHHMLICILLPDWAGR